MAVWWCKHVSAASLRAPSFSLFPLFFTCFLTLFQYFLSLVLFTIFTFTFLPLFTYRVNRRSRFSLLFSSTFYPLFFPLSFPLISLVLFIYRVTGDNASSGTLSIIDLPSTLQYRSISHFSRCGGFRDVSRDFLMMLLRGSYCISSLYPLFKHM